jgi:hypothetical protein
MKRLFWSYESSLGSYNCISIRSYGDVGFHFYTKYLNEIIEKYSKSIIKISNIDKLGDGTYVCMLDLNNSIDFKYPKYYKK